MEKDTYINKKKDPIVSMGIYSLGTGKMVRIDVPENHKKNDLAVGTILQLQGSELIRPKYVIVKNLGISENSAAYGTKYRCVNLDDFTFKTESSVYLQSIADKKDNRIQLYITEKILSADETLAIYEKALATEKQIQTANEKKHLETERLIQKGKELVAKYIPADAKALIVAIYEIDDCDSQADYYATKYGERVVLGWSKHTRDIFSEMRKCAGKIKETEHLVMPPEINNNGEHKNKDNKSWFHPVDEHREKYSMGAGYYLKAEDRYSTGWKIQKHRNSKGVWDDSIYISLARRCVL